MDLPKTIHPDELASLYSGQVAPLVVDLRKDPDYAADPRLLPGAVKRSLAEIETWGEALPRGRPLVVYCEAGKSVGNAGVDWLRAHGLAARQVEGGFVAWRAAGLRLEPAGRA